MPAGPHLRALIVAALTTGCRVGELLSLQWSQIRRDDKDEARWIVLSAAKTKTSETRVIPTSANLRTVFELRRHAPDGKEYGPSAYAFGNEAGERVTSIRTAWELTCKRASITGLHFHDLRRGHCQVDGKLVDRPPRYWAPARREPAMLGIKSGRSPQLDNTLRCLQPVVNPPCWASKAGDRLNLTILSADFAISLLSSGVCRSSVSSGSSCAIHRAV